MYLFNRIRHFVNCLKENYEVETFEAILKKNEKGLGITIAGYVGEKSIGMCFLSVLELSYNTSVLDIVGFSI